MRLFEVFKSSRKKLSESGSLPGVGAIHISEINPTLKPLEAELGVDLINNVLGSVGKRKFSGDIDIAIDIKPEEIAVFMKKLQASPLVIDMNKSSVIMTKVKIQNYDPSLETDLLRTGYVQIDYMLGDPSWMKTFYHSPREEESKYKGVFRTVLLSTIASWYKQTRSKETTPDGRPLETVRYMLSPRDGLVKVKRTPVLRADGKGYTKKWNDKIIDGPWRTADDIAKVLNLGSAENLNSYESLKQAIEQNYPPEVVKNILDQFVKNRDVQRLGVPEDL